MKMTAKERKQAEDLQKVLQQALDDCRAALKADDEECAKAATDTEAAAIKAVADHGTGDLHQQIARGVLAIREMGGRRGGPR